MKKPIAILFVIALTLSACMSSSEGMTSAPQVTVTPEVTVTLPPTPTQTLTPLPAEVVEAQKYFADKGFEVTPDGKIIDNALGTEIAGLTIVPFDEKTMINRGRPTDPVPTWALQRIYAFEDKSDFIVSMTQYDIIVEGGKFDMFGWIYENGKFTRQKVEFAAPNNGIVEIDGYSPEEVQYMIMTNSSLNNEHRNDTVQGRSKIAQDLLKYRTEIIDGNWKVIYAYSGMREIKPLSQYVWGANFIPNRFAEDWKEIDSSEYVIISFGDRNRGLIAWYDANGQGQVRAIDGKWLDIPKYFNKYWEAHEWQGQQ